MNWREEIRPLVVSVALGAVTLGTFVAVAMFVGDPVRYQSGPFIAGLLFFGFVIALCTFFVVLAYGVPVHLLFRRLGLEGLRYYAIAGVLPAVPLFVLNYPELYAAMRVALFGLITAAATWAARFVLFSHRPAVPLADRES